MSWPPTNNQATLNNKIPAGQTPIDYNMYYSQSLTPEQQLANWQQWTTYQHQYAQWHAQYGEQYANLQKMQQAQTQQQQPPLPYTEPVPPPPPEEPEKPPEPPINQMPSNDIFTRKPLSLNTASDRNETPTNSNKSNDNISRNQFQREDNSKWNENNVWNLKNTNNNTNSSNYNNRNSYANNSKWNNNRHDNQNSRNFQNSSNIDKFGDNSNQTINTMKNEIKDLLSEDEIAFDLQFKKWEDEFANWKRQNANHPDKTAYAAYELKFEECRKNLLERRMQMRRNKLEDLKTNELPTSHHNEFNRDDMTNNQDMKNTFSDFGNSKMENHSIPVKPGSFMSSTAESIFKSSASSGIPGLDLVTEKNNDTVTPTENEDDEITEFINLADDQDKMQNEPAKPVKNNLEDNSSKMQNKSAQSNQVVQKEMIGKTENNSQKPQLKADRSNESSVIPNSDLSALSQGINQILGDQNLLSLLSFVKDGKLNQQNSSTVTNPLLAALKQPSATQFQNEGKHNSDGYDNYSNARFNSDNNTDFRNFNNRNNNQFDDNQNNSFSSNRRGDNRENMEGNRKRTFSESSATFSDSGNNNYNNKNNTNNSNNRSFTLNIWEKDNPVQNQNVNRNFNEQNSNNNFRTNSSQQQLNNSIWAVNQNFRPNNNQNSNFNDNSNRNSFNNDFDNKQNDPIDSQPNRSAPFANNNNNTRNTSSDVGNSKLRSLMEIDPFECDKSIESNRSPPITYDRLIPGNDVLNEMDSNRSASGNSDLNRSNYSEENINQIPNQQKIVDTNIDDENEDEFFRPAQVIDYQNKPTIWRSEPIVEKQEEPEVVFVPATVIDYEHKKIVPVAPEPKKVVIENLENLPEYKPAEIIDYQHSVERVHETHGKNFCLNTINLYNKCMVKKRKYLENISIKYGLKIDGMPELKVNDTKVDSTKVDIPKENNSKGDITKIDATKVDITKVDNAKENNSKVEVKESDGVDSSNPGYPGKWVLISPEKRINKNPTKRGKRKSVLKMKAKKAELQSLPVPEDLEDISSSEENDIDSVIEIFDDASVELISTFENKKKEIKVQPVKTVLFKNAISTESEKRVLLIEDLLLYPGRRSRPSKFVIILRGPPGSGKTHLSKLIKDKEAEMEGSNPRILNIDDYFMTETETSGKCPETGRKVQIKKMVYEYDADMEEQYMQYLLKSYKKTITDGLFDFIIVDCINQTMDNYLDFYHFGKIHGFTMYTCELEMNVQTCFKRNIHNRPESEIQAIVDNWVPTPEQNLIIDASYLLLGKKAEKIDLEMEEISNDEDELPEAGDNNDVCQLYSDDEEVAFGLFKGSKWDNDPSEQNLARLDGINKPLKPTTFEDYLQDDEFITPVSDKPGRKRVRWADIEAKRSLDKMRAIGFVVGQTDWNRMMDPTEGSSALTQTKYIERVRKD